MAVEKIDDQGKGLKIAVLLAKLWHSGRNNYFI